MTESHFIVLVVLIIVAMAALILSIYLEEREVPDWCGYLDVQSTRTIKVPKKQYHPKKLEAVSVCVGYADFLAWTLPHNKNLFDRLVIVTTPDDEDTQRLCEFWHVECVQTNAFYEDGDTFNKGKGINRGLDRLSLDGWVLHFDSDIFLFPRTKEVLNLIPLDEAGIYGVDRHNCFGARQWAEYLANPEILHKSSGFVALNRFENGARLMNLDRDGYVPIGYFQLWNPEGSGVYEYPEEHGHADRSDTLFSYNWARQDRHLIPELACIHLESEEGLPLGVNWQGRTSARFCV